MAPTTANLLAGFLALVAINSMLRPVEGTVKMILQNWKYRTCLNLNGNNYLDNNLGLALFPCQCPISLVGLSGEGWTTQWGGLTTTSTLVNTLSLKCITVNGGVTANGIIDNQYDCVGSNNQNWVVVGTFPGGPFQIKSALGQCLTAEGAGGTYMDQWDCVDVVSAPHQFWSAILFG